MDGFQRNVRLSLGQLGRVLLIALAALALAPAAHAGGPAMLVGTPGRSNFVVDTEPNLNRFWLPQFNADGSDAAAPAFETLLAQTYDAVKAVAPATTVIGAGLSPRGGDRPGTGRDTHSPTVFI